MDTTLTWSALIRHAQPNNSRQWTRKPCDLMRTVQIKNTLVKRWPRPTLGAAFTTGCPSLATHQLAFNPAPDRTGSCRIAWFVYYLVRPTEPWSLVKGALDSSAARNLWHAGRVSQRSNAKSSTFPVISAFCLNNGNFSRFYGRKGWTGGNCLCYRNVTQTRVLCKYVLGKQKCGSDGRDSFVTFERSGI